MDKADLIGKTPSQLQKLMADTLATWEFIHNFELQQNCDSMSKRASELKSIDICFVFDCTYSMRNIIQGAVEKMREVQTAIKKNAGSHAEVRVAVVGYRDRNYDDKALEVHDFTSEIDVAHAHLSGLKALPGEGSDACEDPMSGLRAAAKLTWGGTTRVLFLLTDCPQHGRRFHNWDASLDFSIDDERQQSEPEEVIGALVEKQTSLFCLRFNSNCDKMYEVFRDIYDKSSPVGPMQVLSADNSAESFAELVTESTIQSFSDSWERLTAADCQLPQTAPHRVMTLNVDPDIDWDGASEWRLHPVVTTSASLEALHKPVLPNKTTCDLRIRWQPFSSGAMRYAFPAVDTNSGHKHVVKLYHSISKKDSVHGGRDLVVQEYARFLAAQFSKFAPDAALEVIRCWKIDIKDAADLDSHFQSGMLERYLSGDYERYTNNAGYIANGAGWAETFSHWSWHFTAGEMMVSDLQGVGGGMLTDPQIHTQSDTDARFGQGNLRARGIERFFSKHQCNDLCSKLNLRRSPLQLGSFCESVETGSIGSTVDMDFPLLQLAHSSSGKMFSCCGCSSNMWMSGIQFNKHSEKYGGTFCRVCLVQVRRTRNQTSCATPKCKHPVLYSTFALTALKSAAPHFCKECRRHLNTKHSEEEEEEESGFEVL